MNFLRFSTQLIACIIGVILFEQRINTWLNCAAPDKCFWKMKQNLLHSDAFVLTCALLKIDRWSARPQCHACHCASGVNLTWLPLLKELLDNNQYFNAVLVACKSDSNHSRVVRKPISTATHSCPSTATHSCPSTTTHSYPSTATHSCPSTATHSCPSLLREGGQGRRL